MFKPHLVEAQVEPEMTSTTELVLAAGSFLDAVEAGSLSHSDQPSLNDGAVSATNRPLGSGFAWSEAGPPA